MDNFKLVYGKLSNAGGHHLCSLMNDEARHLRLVSALESALVSSQLAVSGISYLLASNRDSLIPCLVPPHTYIGK